MPIVLRRTASCLVALFSACVVSCGDEAAFDPEIDTVAYATEEIGQAPARLLAAGDIARCDYPYDEATAELTERLLADGASNTRVLLLGDNVYMNGTLDEYRGCFAPSWGRDAIRTRTLPTLGNHEYGDPGAAGYFTYFDPYDRGIFGARDRGYYSTDFGGWHLVALNSNCDAIGGCGPGSGQEQWLRRDLANSPAQCTLAFFHHPLFSSAENGPHPQLQPLWQALYDHGADVVLNGHDHVYERFAQQNADGVGDGAFGLRQFIVGTGGYERLYGFITTANNSYVRHNASHGVLELSLYPDAFEFRFTDVNGQVIDTSDPQGPRPCHGAPGTPPTFASSCGDAVCQPDEIGRCAADCFTCGDGACEIARGETEVRCPGDCSFVNPGGPNDAPTTPPPSGERVGGGAGDDRGCRERLDPFSTAALGMVIGLPGWRFRRRRQRADGEK